MQEMPTADLVSLISFLVALLIFFSIDMKARERRDKTATAQERAFTWLSHIGGLATSIALALAWIDLFLPDESELIHVMLLALPGTIGVLCAITLSVELMFRADITETES